MVQAKADSKKHCIDDTDAVHSVGFATDYLHNFTTL